MAPRVRRPRRARCHRLHAGGGDRGGRSSRFPRRAQGRLARYRAQERGGRGAARPVLACRSCRGRPRDGGTARAVHAAGAARGIPPAGNGVRRGRGHRGRAARSSVRARGARGTRRHRRRDPEGCRAGSGAGDADSSPPHARLARRRAALPRSPRAVASRRGGRRRRCVAHLVAGRRSRTTPRRLRSEPAHRPRRGRGSDRGGQPRNPHRPFHQGASPMSWTRSLLALMAAMVLAAHPAAAQSVLRIGLNDDPDALDPTISRAYTGRLVFAALCDKLFDVTPELKIVPQLATSYEWGPNQRSVVLKLRPGVKFHDGEPFNAEAVRFNIERHLNTPGSFRKSEIGEIKSVDVVNDLTVRLNLSEPLVPLIAALTDRAGMMISPKAARELGDKFGTRPVCAGPYKFVERVAQGKIVGERFADYWDKGTVHIDRVEFVPITDSTARLASLRSGDLQMIERVSPTDLAEIRGDARLRVSGVAELGYQTIPLNVNNGPRGRTLADVRLRQAIDLAIDRETLVKTVFNNEYIAGNQWVSPPNYYYDK